MDIGTDIGGRRRGRYKEQILDFSLDISGN